MARWPLVCRRGGNGTKLGKEPLMTSSDGREGVPPQDERPVPRYGQYAPPPAPAPTGPQQPSYGQPSYGQPQYGQPQHGQPGYGQPQYGQPQYGQPQYGSGAAPTGFTGAQGVYVGHTTAARPGIIPLRPLRVGEFLDGSFGALRSNPRVMLGLTAMVMSVVMVVAVLAELAATRYLPGIVTWLVGGAGTDPEAVDLTGADSGSLILQGTAALLMLLVSPMITGMLTYSVSRSVLGSRATVAEVWQACRRQLGWLLLLTIVVGLGLTAITALGVLGVVGAVALGTEVSTAAGVVVGILAVGLAVVGLVWFSIRTLLAAPALVLEKLGMGTALARGWRLSRGAFWRLLGLYVLTNIVVNVVTSVLMTPLTIGIAFAAYATPSPIVMAIVTGVLYTVLYTITIAFLASVVALLYIDVRMRREGLDVELTAAASRLAEG